MRLALGIIIGLALGISTTIATHHLVRSRLGRHIQRWIFYTDARHTHPGLYSWRLLA